MEWLTTIASGISLGGITAALTIKAFVSLLVVIDPPSNGVIYLGLVSGNSPKDKLRIALRGHITAFGILALFVLFGVQILAILGITMPAFRIASGFMLFVVGLDMTMRRRNQRRGEGAQKAAAKADDVAIFPLGMPLLAGPGAIAAVMLPVSETGGSLAEALVMVVVTAAVMAFSYLTFWLIIRFERVVNYEVFEQVLTRLMGLLLAALAAQFMIDGVRQAFGIS